MATLHNRLCKAEFYSDPELLSLPRDVRHFYRDLWHAAEDSGCLEDSPFGWKIILYPSPLDADVTVELIAEWRDMLVQAGKLIPYKADGKSYLFLTNFLRHQSLTNPKRSDLPLPPWVTLAEHPTDNRKRLYKITGTVGQQLPDTTSSVEQALSNASATVEQALSNASATVEQEQNRTEPKLTEPNLNRRVAVDEAPPVDNVVAVPLTSAEHMDEHGLHDRHVRDSSSRSNNEALPEVPVSLCGPIAHIIGTQRVDELLREGTDLNVTVARFIARIDALVDKTLAELAEEKRALARDRCRRAAFERIAATHAAKVDNGGEGIRNLPAYLTKAAKTALLGDLVGDDLVRELRTAGRPKRSGNGEPRHIADVLDDHEQAQAPADKFPAEVAS